MKYALSSPVGGHSSRHLVLATKGHPFNNALSHNEPTGQTNRKTPSKKNFPGNEPFVFRSDARGQWSRSSSGRLRPLHWPFAHETVKGH